MLMVIMIAILTTWRKRSIMLIMKNTNSQDTTNIAENIVTTIAQRMDDMGAVISDTLYNALIEDMSNSIEESKYYGDDDLTEYIQNYYTTFSNAIAAVDFAQVVKDAT